MTTDNPKRTCAELGVCQSYTPPCGQCHWMDAYDIEPEVPSLWENLATYTCFIVALTFSVAVLAGTIGYLSTP